MDIRCYFSYSILYSLVKMKTEKAIILTLPFLPPSVNEAYAGYPRRHKTDKYKKFERDIDIFFRKLPKYEIEGEKFMEVRYEFHFELFFKNGNIRKRDVGNFEKILSDTLAHHIVGFEDEKIAKLILTKFDDNKEYTNIFIAEL